MSAFGRGAVKRFNFNHLRRHGCYNAPIQVLRTPGNVQRRNELLSTTQIFRLHQLRDSFAFGNTYPPFTGSRSYATVMRQVKIDHYISSPGMIAEPYRPPPPPLPFMQRWFTKQGWRMKKRSLMEVLKTAYALAKLRQKNKHYSQKIFYREAADLYKEINSVSASGDKHGKLRRLVTEHFYSTMKNQIRQREANFHHIHWEMVGPIKLMKTLQARMIGLEKENLDNSFVQITLRIRSHQIFAAYDKKDNVVKGDPEKPMLVEDIWVFEKHLTRPQSVWRLCGQIHL